MNSAERFQKIMHYQPVDHVTDMEFGYWDEVLAEWPEQGLPAEVERTHRAFELYFGLEQPVGVPVNVMLNPPFFPKLIEVKDGYEYSTDWDGVLCRLPEDHHSTIPEHLDYPLKDERDWEEKFLPHLDPDDPARIAETVEADVQAMLDRNEIPQLYVGSLLGTPRNWMGFEQIAMALYLNPTLVERVVEHLAQVTCTVLEKVLPRVQGKVGWAHFWEDICFNTGPLCPPEVFRQLCVPRYKRITKLLNDHGIDIISLDCDGQIHQLVDCWLEAGVNTMFPLEQNGGSDVVEFRKRWGRDLRLMGGVDKMKMAQGGDVIRRELERIAPVAQDGGFIPFCDHRCPPDVTLEKYRHYLQCKREIFGIPQKEEKVRASGLEI